LTQQVEEQINQGGHGEEEGQRESLENRMKALRSRLCCLTGQAKVAGAMDYVRENVFPGDGGKAKVRV